MSSFGFLRVAGERTVGDVLRAKSGALPDLVHTHPSETVRDAIQILREYGVSQMPVVKAEPPVMAGEVAGSVERHMGEALPLVGAGEPIATARHELERADAIMVVEDGKPAGVLTRADLLSFLAD